MFWQSPVKAGLIPSSGSRWAREGAWVNEELFSNQLPEKNPKERKPALLKQNFRTPTLGVKHPPKTTPHEAKNRLMDTSAIKTQGKVKTSVRRRGRQRMRWLDGIINLRDMSLSELGAQADLSGSW